jgi:hypothetical protein
LATERKTDARGTFDRPLAMYQGMDRHRFIGRLVSILVAGGLMVFGTTAAFGHTGLFRPSSDKQAVIKSSTCTSSEKTTSDKATSDEGNESDEGDDCEAPQPHPSPTDTPPPPASGDREAQCKAAAGITGTSLTETASTGLDHAIQVVLGNCIRNSQAPGLLNALRHLVANRDRHMAREADKAARRAAKAASHGGNGHGHGN